MKRQTLATRAMEMSRPATKGATFSVMMPFVREGMSENVKRTRVRP